MTKARAKKVKKVKKSAQQGSRAVARPAPLSVQEELGALARSTIERLERQDRRDWEMNKKFENEPMVGEAVWHVHHRR